MSKYERNTETIEGISYMLRNHFKLYNPDLIEFLLDSHYNGNIQCRERNFCYELYFQWKKIIEVSNLQHKEKCPYLNLVLNGEVNKANLTSFIYKNEKKIESLDYLKDITKLLKVSKIKQDAFEPDLTLHGGNGNFLDQRLIVEVKTELSEKDDVIINDYFKLLIYHVGFFFKEVVFIAVKIDPNKLKKVYNAIPKELINKYKVSLIIRDDIQIILTTVYDLLNDKDPIKIESITNT